MLTPERGRRAISEAMEAGESLRAMNEHDLVSALAEASALLANPRTDIGAAARAKLQDSTALSAAMVDWALGTTLGTATGDVLTALRRDGLAGRRGAIAVPHRLAVVVLAGNVFTACVRAVLLPLLCRVPVVAKAPVSDDVLPRLLQQAIARVDQQLGACVQVLTFPGGSVGVEDMLFSQADVVVAYGSDSTISDIRARLPATTRLIEHGHGLGVAFVAASTNVGDAATALALDAAAYDQRGCLSPHAVWVERGGDGRCARGRELAAALFESLGGLAGALPRGPLPVEAGAAQLQWRGVAAVRGELYEGDGFAVSWEADAALRLSPGYRNVQVLECASPHDLGRRIRTLGAHLKAIGVGGICPAELASCLPPGLAPRVTRLGHMQTPPFDALADGELPVAGLVRWMEVSNGDS